MIITPMLFVIVNTQIVLPGLSITLNNSMANGTRRFMLNSQRPSYNPCPEPNQSNFSYWHISF